MTGCIVKGCPHRTGLKTKYPHCTLHCFPNNINMIKNWLLQTGQDFGDIDVFSQKVLEGKKYHSYRMCSCHFSLDSYMNQGSKIILKPNAVPTLFTQASFPFPLYPLIAVQPPERPTIDNGAGSTFSTVIRVVSRLRTVYTQTDKKILQHDQSCCTDHWINQRNVATQTDLPLPKEELEAHSGLQHRMYDTCDVETDHLCPDNFTKSSLHQSGKKKLTEETDYITDRKFIIFESCLDQLLSLIRCQHHGPKPCLSPVTDIKKVVEGSMIIVYLKCLDDHLSYRWFSQPTEGNVPIGNLQMAASILFSGSNFKKVEEMFSLCGIPAITDVNYYKYQRHFLFPAIQYEWELEQDKIKNDLSDKAVVLAGGSHFDGPGHSLKYCTYALIDSLTQKISSFKVNEIGTEKASAEKEEDALKVCLDELMDMNVDIRVVGTKNHAGICKLMSTKYRKIDHQVDIWHISKDLTKKLVLASKKKNCAVIVKWIVPIRNHLWWCTQTCSQNPDLLIAKWRSLIFHIANVHIFPHYKQYPRCEHRNLSREKMKNTAWIANGHVAHQTLQSIINAPQLLKDLRKITKFCHTGSLKAFSAKISKYRPKFQSFDIDAVSARTMLAALSHNRNVCREQATIKLDPKSTLQFKNNRHKVLFPKQKKITRDRSMYTQSTDGHFFDTMRNSVKIMKGELRYKRHNSHVSTFTVNTT